MISIAEEPIAGKRVIIGVYREAPRYDWDRLKIGVDSIAPSNEDQKKILTLTHEWAYDMLMAKKEKQNSKGLRHLFNDAPEEAKAFVLKGVQALLEGYEAAYITAISEEEPIFSKMAISVVSDSETSLDIVKQIQERLTGLDNTMLSNTPEEGLEQVLSEFGIFEC